MRKVFREAEPVAASAMTAVWVICAMAVSLATGFALPAMAEEQDVAGIWSGTIIVHQGGKLEVQDEFTLVLKQEGQALTGIWSMKTRGQGRRGGRTSEDRPANGTITGDKLSLKIGAERWLEATVNGDSMSGNTANRNNPAGRVTGTRAQ